MSLVLKKILIFIAVLFLVFTTTYLKAQTSLFFSVRYSDSVQKEPNSDFVYNNISITNTFGKPMVLFLTIQAPEGWRLLANNQTAIELQAGETYMLPVAFSKTPNALASWSPVTIQVQLQNAPQIQEYKFYIKAKARSNYYSRIDVNDIVLHEYNDSVGLKLYIRNTGNIVQHYKIYLKNKYFELENKELSVNLQPSKDTNFVYYLRMNKTLWRYLNKEEIRVNMCNDSGRSRAFSYTIRKVSSSNKMNESQYKTFPVTIEGGISAYGKQIAYYGGFSGALKINDESNIAFNYRSPQYGIQAIQPAYWGITYNYRNLQLYAGQILDQRVFSTNGQGMKLTYRWGKDDFFSVYGIKHYTGFSQTNDVAAATAQYHINSVKIRQDIAASYDAKNHVQSYAFQNDIKLIKTKNLSLEVTGGAGFDHYTIKTYDSTNDIPGGSIGYNFGFRKKHFSVSSSALYYDDNFPGIMKGYKMNSDAITWQSHKVSAGLFYQSMYTPNKYFKDSIYNSNTFALNVSNYGVNVGWHANRMEISLSTGIMTQLGVPNSPPHYQSFGLDYNYSLKNLTISLSSLAGYSNAFGGSDKNISLFIERASFSAKYGGVFIYYSHLPNNSLLNTNPTSIESAGYIENITISPYVDLHLFHNTIIERLQLNDSKYDNVKSLSASSNLMYENKHKGFQVLLTNLLQGGSNSISSNLTFRKDLNVPLIIKKEFCDLKIVLFIDENNNGKLDSNEEVIKNAELNINDYPMLTDESGSVLYENIKKGSYKLDFSHVKGLRGLAPTRSIKQVVSVERNTTEYIPFKRSKNIYGRIHIDNEGSGQSPLENFKVIATDTSGFAISTFTNEAGEYYLNLPSNKYVVSLNPQAFDDIYKPVQMSYDIDLVNNEEASVNFKILKRKRDVNIIPANLK